MNWLRLSGPPEKAPSNYDCFFHSLLESRLVGSFYHLHLINEYESLPYILRVVEVYINCVDSHQWSQIFERLIRLKDHFQYIFNYFNILVQHIGSTLWCASPPAYISSMFWINSTFWFNIFLLHYGVPHHLQMFPMYFE